MTHLLLILQFLPLPRLLLMTQVLPNLQVLPLKQLLQISHVLPLTQLLPNLADSVLMNDCKHISITKECVKSVEFNNKISKFN